MASAAADREDLMHPPFGFAPFYLRRISDTLFKSGGLRERVKSSDIYMGAILWVSRCKSCSS